MRLLVQKLRYEMEISSSTQIYYLQKYRSTSIKLEFIIIYSVKNCLEKRKNNNCNTLYTATVCKKYYFLLLKILIVYNTTEK